MSKKSDEQNYARFLPSVIGLTIRYIRKGRGILNKHEFRCMLEEKNFSKFGPASRAERDWIVGAIEEDNQILSFKEFTEICMALNVSVEKALVLAAKIHNFDRRIKSDLQTFVFQA